MFIQQDIQRRLENCERLEELQSQTRSFKVTVLYSLSNNGAMMR